MTDFELAEVKRFCLGMARDILNEKFQQTREANEYGKKNDLTNVAPTVEQIMVEAEKLLNFVVR